MFFIQHFSGFLNAVIVCLIPGILNSHPSKPADPEIRENKKTEKTNFSPVLLSSKVRKFLHQKQTLFSDPKHFFQPPR
ncbi:predicted protein [Methanosarcina acetivorans C2A]|uniref:Uncharacterized protein n=1 Tax=Methanosarcina acetivorans (strain ATCC 35395 / DSM 2834 / JCM 12185 / C2A) TaxID=188937 RepID=Q8TI56_METAC|nr:predicted protein [Methanosarcina acetivorans C2A]